MKENTDSLQTGQARQTQNLDSRLGKRFPKVCTFPARPDAEIQIAKATARRLKIPYADLSRVPIEPAAVAMLKPDIAMRRQALPIRRVDNILLVVMANPDQPIAIRSLEVLTGCKIRPVAAAKSALFAALEQAYKQPAGAAGKSYQPPLGATETKAVKQKKTRAVTMSIISNKGGVGKTHLSINLAHAMAKAGAKVLLIDADFGNADISNKIGLFSKYHLMGFLEKTQEMQDIIISTKFDFDLICSTYGEFRLANLTYAQKVKFIRHFKKVSQGYDFAIFDLGAGIARTILDFGLAAERTVILTTPQDLISGYACAKAAFSRFREIEERLEARFPKYRPQLTFSPALVINQVDSVEQGLELHEKVRTILNKNVNANESRFRIEVEYLGSIPYDRESIRSAEVRRKPLLVHLPYVKAAQCIRHISTRFTDAEKSYESKVRFRHPFRRFFAVLSQKV